MTTLLLTTEQALKAIAEIPDVSAYEGLFSSVQYYTGINNESKKAPCVICSATEATEEVVNLGVYNVRAQITVKERASATATTTTLADTIFRGFLTGSIEQDLKNQVSNYHVHNVYVENKTASEEGKMWVQQLNLMIMCCMTQ